jgi:hypothetical protein
MPAENLVFSPDSCRPRVAAPPAYGELLSDLALCPIILPDNAGGKAMALPARRPPLHPADASTTRPLRRGPVRVDGGLPSEYEEQVVSR